ncbi:MAG: type II toxin-antitoxin system HicA family toxin [Candidatus Poribacteria bacterium]|nr:type II toxin-antitoxin system HicA family toxin [Candidatus Poribacteria bacterium]
MAISSREVIKRLRKEKWMLVHVVGSHHHYKYPNKPGRVTVPLYLHFE